MTFHSLIKATVVGAFCLWFSIGTAQELDETNTAETESSSTFYNNEARQRFFAFMIGGHRAFTSGDNFMGEGLEGGSGIDFRVQMYIYKHFFVGLASNATYFDVKNQELLGSYRNSRVAGNYVYLGYEFLPAEDFRLGLQVSVSGDVDFKNTGFSTTDIAEQHDSARLNRYGFYLNYELAPHFMLYLDYGYNVLHTDIEAPSAYESFFSKGTYSTVGLGLVFTIGRRDLISRFLE
ncbi:MAG: outer membrane beta-barrel protein [Winogradskyella arenosi]